MNIWDSPYEIKWIARNKEMERRMLRKQRRERLIQIIVGVLSIVFVGVGVWIYSTV